MLQISAELLAISSEAAILVKNKKVIFANAEAMALLGKDCIGKTLNALLGMEISSIQASSYIGEFTVKDKRYIVRERSFDGIRAIFFSCAVNSEPLINEAFIYSLRNSLMSIEVALSLLRDNTQAHPELHDSLAVISHDSYKINRILTNMTILHALRKDDAHFAPEEINISKFVEDITESTALFIKGPEIKFNAEAEIKIFADPAMIEALMLNLISNCLTHAHNCQRISINIAKIKNRVIISVDDDGCGIDPGTLHQVFDRYRHGFEIDNISKGPGLGLSVARAVAGCHGGTLLLESRPGSGTAVRVSLSTNPYHGAACLNSVPPYIPNMKSLLTGLAHCLPAGFYTDKYIE